MVLKRRFFPPFRRKPGPPPGAVPPAAAALLVSAALVLSGCPHSVGWSGEIPLGSPVTVVNVLSWTAMIDHMNANPLMEGTVVYELDPSTEWSPPVSALSHGDPASANCPQTVIIRGNGKTVGLTNPGALLAAGPGVDLTLQNITLQGVSGNSAPLIKVEGGTVRFEGGIIEKNKNENFPGYGGAVAVTGGGAFYLSGGDLRENVASGYGGAVYVENGEAYLSGGRIYHNQAGSGGGAAVYRRDSAFSRARLELSGDALIERNTVTGSGGGVYIENCDTGGGAKFGMTGGTIENNTALVNTAGHGGGGVGIGYNGVFNLAGGEIVNNAANSGGGVYVHITAAFDMAGGTIRGNGANQGEGVYVGGTFTMRGSAQVDAGNPVYLYAVSAPAYITVPGPLTAHPAAHITLGDWALNGWQVLKGDTAANYSRFTIGWGSINSSGIWSSP